MQGDGKNWRSGGEMSDPDKEVEKMSFWSPWSAVKALSEKKKKIGSKYLFYQKKESFHRQLMGLFTLSLCKSLKLAICKKAPICETW